MVIITVIFEPIIQYIKQKMELPITIMAVMIIQLDSVTKFYENMHDSNYLILKFPNLYINIVIIIQYHFFTILIELYPYIFLDI